MKRIFVRLLMGSLILGSIISIGIFLFGEFGSTESKILWSLFSLGVFSLLGLCSSLIYPEKRFEKPAIVGITFAIISFFLSVIAIWDVFDMDYLGKPMIVLIVIAVAIAHISLLLQLRRVGSVVGKVRAATIGAIIALACLIICGIIFELFDLEMFRRVLGALAILDVLGTILVPILYYTQKDQKESTTSINYNNRRFRVMTASGNSETDETTIFHYRQDGDILTCSYSGGSIVSGHLIGQVATDGRIDMRYHQINEAGELMTGICTSTPEVLPSGKIKLHEEWRWTSGDMSKGTSALIEL